MVLKVESSISIVHFNRLQACFQKVLGYVWEGVIRTHAMPPGQTVNADYYFRLLRHLRSTMRCKRRHLLQINVRIMLHERSLLDRRQYSFAMLVVGNLGTPSLLACHKSLLPRSVSEV
ncbi:hypothetical protein TNCV_3842101 [Trichonephila clavipes]|nr:hypothetical protein TNCV_3842101 [Trichonephila clavipes]